MLEDQPTPEDNVLHANGVRVYIDTNSIPLIQGSRDRLRRHPDGRGLHGQQPERGLGLRLRLQLPDRRGRRHAALLLPLTTAGPRGPRCTRSRRRRTPGGVRASARAAAPRPDTPFGSWTRDAGLGASARAGPIAGRQEQDDKVFDLHAIARPRPLRRLRPAVGFGALVAAPRRACTSCRRSTPRSGPGPIRSSASCRPCAVLVGVAVHRPAHPGPVGPDRRSRTSCSRCGDVTLDAARAAGEAPFPSLADARLPVRLPACSRVAFLWVIADPRRARRPVGDARRRDPRRRRRARRLGRAPAAPILEAPGDPLELAISVAYPLGDLSSSASRSACSPRRARAARLRAARRLARRDVRGRRGLRPAGRGRTRPWTAGRSTSPGCSPTRRRAARPCCRRCAASPCRARSGSPGSAPSGSPSRRSRCSPGPSSCCSTCPPAARARSLLAVGSAVLSLMVLARLAAVVRALARDNAARRALEEELSYRASHDPLTGLANRRRFMECLEAAVAGAAGQPDLRAVPGPRRLQGRQRRARPRDRRRGAGRRREADPRPPPRGRRRGAHGRRRVRDPPPCRRDGGDERRPAAARRASASPSPSAARPLVASGSIGVAVGAPGQHASELLADADVAMYAAKAQGCGRVVAFEPGMRHAPARPASARAADAAARTVHAGPVGPLARADVGWRGASGRWPAGCRGGPHADADPAVPAPHRPRPGDRAAAARLRGALPDHGPALPRRLRRRSASC